MSKNITIKEDGTAKAMSSVSLLNLKLQSGGGSDWVPEDETPLAKIDITHNGEYVASADGYYGYGLVRVNVAGGASAEQSGTAPTNIEGGYTVSDYDPAIDVKPYEFQQPDIGGIGSSITGISPYTGEWQNVSVDSEGNLTWEDMDAMPYAITIVKGPHKKYYLEDEEIDLTGIQVRLINENGSIYADKDHPYGIVKREELTFEPSHAIHGTWSANGLTEGLLEYIDSIDFDVASALHYEYNWGTGSTAITEENVTFSSSVRVFVYTYSSTQIGYVAASDSPFTYTQDNVTGNASSYENEGKTVYKCDLLASTGNILTPSASCPINSVKKSTWNSSAYFSNNAAWSMFYAEQIKPGNTVTVKWIRPQDGQILTSDFQISVGNQATGGGGNFSGGGGGGYGDNGGGGAF